MVKSIYSSRVAQHQNPIPAAAVHRGLLITSAIIGKELHTDAYPQEKEKQVELVFEYLAIILDEAGATLQDIVKIDLYFADKKDRDLVNPHWLRLYPDETQRPARQAHTAVLPAGCCLHLVATAMLDPLTSG